MNRAHRQDQLFSEVERVLPAGGVFAGRAATSGLRIRLFHLFDTFEPLDPKTLRTRLEGAGFTRLKSTSTTQAFASSA
jgi:hypothetical protein